MLNNGSIYAYSSGDASNLLHSIWEVKMYLVRNIFIEVRD